MPTATDRVTIRVTLGGAEVAKWLSLRMSRSADMQTRARRCLLGDGLAITSCYDPIYKNYPPGIGEMDVPYLGEDATVEIAVYGSGVPLNSNQETVAHAIAQINWAANDLVDKADKVLIEVQREPTT